MTADCRHVHFWPDMAARVQGESPCNPPFLDSLRKANWAFLAVLVPNQAFFQWFQDAWTNVPEETQWEVVLLLDPSYGTKGTSEILEGMFVLQEQSSDRLKVKLLTPGKLGDATPCFSIAVLDVPGEPSTVSIGSSKSFGLGVPAAGDINVWTSISAIQANALRQLVKAYWDIAAELTKGRCEIPLLAPCRGDDEGWIHWQAFEALIGDTEDLLTAESKSITDLPLKRDGTLDEEVVDQNQDQPPGINDHVAKIPPVVEPIQTLYEKGSLTSVQARVKPLSVTIPPSIFGQQGTEQVGAIHIQQRYSIDLFADEATAKGIEKLRKGVTKLIQIFSFSFGPGKYWVPDCARDSLNTAIDALSERSKKAAGVVLGDDISSFLDQRKDAIKHDLEKIYRRFYPTGAMPAAALDTVLDNLRKRAEKANKEGLSPKITSTGVAFRYSTDIREDPWSDAAILLADIIKTPRDMVTDRYAPRSLKQADISVSQYLAAMDVADDSLVRLAKEEGPESPWVVDRARKELVVLSIIESVPSSIERCEALIEVLQGKAIRETDV